MSKSTRRSTTKKAALGRGLGSLLGDSAASATQEDSELSRPVDFSDRPVTEGFLEESAPETSAETSIESQIASHDRIWHVGVEQLVANADQPRKVFSAEALKELSASIKEQGILQPIVARRRGEDSFEIIAGERRWRAAQQAGLQEVPIILKDVDTQKSLELALIENIQRHDLNPIEEAEAYQVLLLDYNMTQQEVADRVGKERATVANLLRLLNLVPELRAAMSRGELAMGQAKLLLSLADNAMQKNIGLKVVRDALTVKETEKLIKASKKQGSSAVDHSLKELDVSKKLMSGLSEELQKILGTKVSIEYSKGKGKLGIHFYSDEELNQFVDRLRDKWQS